MELVRLSACVSGQGCRTGIHGTGPGDPRRQGIQPAAALLSDGSGTLHPDQQEAHDGQAEKVRRPGKPELFRESGPREQRTLDLPGGERDFSKARKDRGKCFNGTLSRWRVCFRHRLKKKKLKNT